MRLSPLLIATLFLTACGVSGPEQAGQKQFSNDTFTLSYPNDWSVEEDAQVVTDAYEVAGIAFLPPVDRDHTTLSEALLHVATPDTCPVLDEAPAEVTVNGETYKHASWTGVGAGNLYEGDTFVQKHGASCRVVTFFAHSCNLGPDDCGPNHPSRYDREALFASFENVMETLVWKN